MDPKDDALLVLGEALASLDGATPMPKISDEATALLTACNSILNSLAIQGAPIPPRLLSDLSAYCREQTGFMVPFELLARTEFDRDTEGHSPERKLIVAGRAMRAHAMDVAMHAHNIGEAGRRSTQDDTRALLDSLGELEMVQERLYQFFGWSKSLVRIAKRASLDRGKAPKH